MNAYARLNPDSVEANLLKQVSTNYDDILKIWSEGLVKMSREENFVSIDTSSESIFPLMLSERTWTESEYVTARKKMVEKISNTQKKRMVSLSIAFSLTKTKKQRHRLRLAHLMVSSIGCSTPLITVYHKKRILSRIIPKSPQIPRARGYIGIQQIATSECS